MKERKKVYVGLSGGVDSSVSALLLKEQGYDVTGVFIKVWQPDFIPCTWREDRLDAMRVAAKLDIPFMTLDLEKEYKEGVIDSMLAEYKAGRTPNPDVFCNKEVKFGAFYSWAREQGADFIATGHYAQIENKKEEYTLTRGLDKSKDQAYFLWAVPHDILPHLLFPVGHLLKSRVRKIAKEYQLATAHKKDSQGLCFISNVDMKSFLKHFIEGREGNVLNENGEVVGVHDGAIFYTIGERHGFTISKKTPKETPYYVIAKNLEKNTLTVSHDPQSETSALSAYPLTSVNIKSPPENFPLACEAEIRYHGEIHPCTLTYTNLQYEATFEKPTLISEGQSIVFYQENVCLGGALLG